MTTPPSLTTTPVSAPLSMTAAGHAQLTCQVHSYLLELKSLNSKGLDVRCALPDELSRLEASARQQLAASLTRGKVELKVRWLGRAYQEGAMNAQLELNEPLFQELLSIHDELNAQHPPVDEGIVGRLMSWPGVITEAGRPTPSELEAPFQQALAQAVQELLEMRRREGEALLTALINHLKRISDLTLALEGALPALQDARAEQLKARLEVLLEGERLNPSDPRLLMELALLADKSDVTEELTRLKAHVTHMESLLMSGQPSGRRCDFLCQELLREANTASSKLHEVEVTHLIVELKAEIERLREQVQNIE